MGSSYRFQSRCFVLLVLAAGVLASRVGLRKYSSRQADRPISIVPVYNAEEAAEEREREATRGRRSGGGAHRGRGSVYKDKADSAPTPAGHAETQPHAAVADGEGIHGKSTDKFEAERHKHEKTYGTVSMPMYAFVLALISGSSLPIGAIMGLLLSPVKDTVCSSILAFGAGALLFAVTVELYGHALHGVSTGHMQLYELNVVVVSAIAGSLFYLRINRWLEEYLMAGGSDEEHHSAVEGHIENKDFIEVERKRQGRGLVGEVADMKSLPNRKLKAKAQAHWRKIKNAVHQAKVVVRMKSVSLGVQKSKSGSSVTHVLEEAMAQVQFKEDAALAAFEQEVKQEVKQAKLVAYGLFLGLVVDGIPEGVLMGFLAAEGHLSPVLVVSLLIANFPEAFASASLMKQAELSNTYIVGVWAGLAVLIASLCGSACFLVFWRFPEFGTDGFTMPMTWLIGISIVEGLTGGAMIACISSVMLPEAFERAGKEGSIMLSSGFWCVLGFLLAVVLKANFG